MIGRSDGSWATRALNQKIRSLEWELAEVRAMNHIIPRDTSIEAKAEAIGLRRLNQDDFIGILNAWVER